MLDGFDCGLFPRTRLKYRAKALVTVKVVSWDLSYGLLNGVYTSYRPLQLKIYALNLSISLSA